MVSKSSQFVFGERRLTDSRIFAHTRWDAIPVVAALLHCAYFFLMFYLFPRPTAMADDSPWFHLLHQHLLEHQWCLPQLHSQSILPFNGAKSLVQHLGVDHCRLQ